jgi:hypothetical protein
MYFFEILTTPSIKPDKQPLSERNCKHRLEVPYH